MNLFGHDCGCDERREYIAANPFAFLVLAGLASAAIWLIYQSRNG